MKKISLTKDDFICAGTIRTKTEKFAKSYDDAKTANIALKENFNGLFPHLSELGAPTTLATKSLKNKMKVYKGYTFTEEDNSALKGFEVIRVLIWRTFKKADKAADKTEGAADKTEGAADKTEGAADKTEGADNPEQLLKRAVEKYKKLGKSKTWIKKQIDSMF
jgi:hypothetical protein